MFMIFVILMPIAEQSTWLIEDRIKLGKDRAGRSSSPGEGRGELFQRNMGGKKTSLDMKEVYGKEERRFEEIPWIFLMVLELPEPKGCFEVTLWSLSLSPVSCCLQHPFAFVILSDKDQQRSTSLHPHQVASFHEAILACKTPKKTASSRLEWKKLGRGVSLVYYQQALQGDFKDRAEMIDFNIRIKNVTRNDAGKYRCEVSAPSEQGQNLQEDTVMLEVLDVLNISGIIAAVVVVAFVISVCGLSICYAQRKGYFSSKLNSPF
ncbi:junctional adhesion molecule B-like protein [Cricetulus griseus]|uniref:Junctional adhesion molecule B-like protein n=1 Tax=Cricetulus griseus TaxID=10029 RepID=A0A061I3Z2_CRIGR|nr:junctional adhesion molecule B-like protein [Cricetulus griseus]